MSLAVLARKTKTMLRMRHKDPNNSQLSGDKSQQSSYNSGQVSYRIFMNRRASGTYKPGGTVCCNKEMKPAKKPSGLYIPPDKTSSSQIENKKQRVLVCPYSPTVPEKPKCCKYPVRCTDMCGTTIKSRLSYSRINHNETTITKVLKLPTSSGDYISKRKARATKCDFP
tara:strand:- start:178 stop:684 length:507 start_codon:yes stop_codon:yes gene_type:complete